MAVEFLGVHFNSAASSSSKTQDPSLVLLLFFSFFLPTLSFSFPPSKELLLHPFLRPSFLFCLCCSFMLSSLYSLIFSCPSLNHPSFPLELVAFLDLSFPLSSFHYSPVLVPSFSPFLSLASSLSFSPFPSLTCLVSFPSILFSCPFLSFLFFSSLSSLFLLSFPSFFSFFYCFLSYPFVLSFCPFSFPVLSCFIFFISFLFLSFSPFLFLSPFPSPLTYLSRPVSFPSFAFLISFPFLFPLLYCIFPQSLHYDSLSWFYFSFPIPSLLLSPFLSSLFLLFLTQPPPSSSPSFLPASPLPPSLSCAHTEPLIAADEVASLLPLSCDTQPRPPPPH